jgi:hypothetical protein
MHEILSMLLIVPFVFHVWRNWATLLSYFSRKPMWIATAVSLVLAAPFVAEGYFKSDSGDPRMAVFSAVNNASLSAVAGLAKIDEAAAVERLKAAGYAGAAVGDSVAELAARAGTDAFDVVGAVLAPAQ